MAKVSCKVRFAIRAYKRCAACAKNAMQRNSKNACEPVSCKPEVTFRFALTNICAAPGGEELRRTERSVARWAVIGDASQLIPVSVITAACNSWCKAATCCWAMVLFANLHQPQ